MFCDFEGSQNRDLWFTLLLICRTIIDTINEAHLKYNECLVPLNRCDDMRSKALMQEVGKVDPAFLSR